MSTRPALNALQLLTSTRWAITRDALERMVAIAERDTDRLMAALETRAERDDDGAEGPAFEPPPRRWALLATPATPHPKSERLGVRDGVAIVSVVGPLCRYASVFQEICGLSSYQLLAEDFRIAAEDPGIRAILVHCDSPGGETNGCAELAALIHAHRGTKPIVAMVSDGAASAAYWVAAACDEIVVTPSAYVGSIGVYFEIVDWSAAEAEHGMKRWRIVSSQSPNKVPDPADAAGKAVLQREVDEFADAFLGAVATYRATTPEALIAAGDGGAVLIGRHAVTAGLADRVATTEEVLAELAQRAASPSTTSAASAAAAPKEPVMSTKTTTAPAPKASDEEQDEEARKRAEEEEKEKEAKRRAEEEADEEGAEADASEDEEEPASEEEEDEMAEEDEQESSKKAARALAKAHPQVVAQIRRRAARAARAAERNRVKALIALAPKAIAPPLKAALENGDSEATAAKAFLAAAQSAGAGTLAVMAAAEASRTPVMPLADADPAARDAGAETVKLLREHSPSQRRRTASRN